MNFNFYSYINFVKFCVFEVLVLIFLEILFCNFVYFFRKMKL